MRHHSKGATRSAAATTTFGVLVWLYGATAVAVDHPGAPSGWIPVSLAFLLIAGATSVVGLRAAFGGAWFEGDTLRVRNPFRTYRVAVDDVAAFAIGKRGRHPCIGLVQSRDGRAIPIIGIRAPYRGDRSRPAYDAVERLNRELCVHRELSTSTGDRDWGAGAE